MTKPEDTLTPEYGHEMNSENSEEKLPGEETGPFPIPSNKFTNPGIKEQLMTLRNTLEQFYLISHRIKNPDD